MGTSGETDWLMSNVRYTAPSPVTTRKKGGAIPISSSIGYMKLTEALMDMGPDSIRLVKAYNNVMDFYYKGILDLQEKEGEKMRKEIEHNAPYDYAELDDYHMKDHIVIKDFSGSIEGSGEQGEGVEIESEAPYSGLLEYGTARHGIQYVFFRPSVELGQRSFKLEVIKEMRKAITV